MEQTVVRYPLDLTGRRNQNLVSDERHTLLEHSGLPYRVVVPDHGFFYTKDLALFDILGNLLHPYRDYIATYTSELTSTLSGLEVCGSIVIINPDVRGPITMEYRAVGGVFIITNDIFEDTLQHLYDLGDAPPEWAGLVGRPVETPPEGVSHELWSLDGFEPFNRSLERLTQVLLTGNQEELQAYRELGKDLYDQALVDNQIHHQALQDHKDDQNDPHDLTQDQVGLSELNNWPIASTDETLSGREDRYITPKRVREGVEELGLTHLEEHLNDHYAPGNNVHGLTPEQLRVFTEDEFDDRLALRLDKTATAVNSALLNNRTYSQVVNTIRSDIPGERFTSGVFNTARLGLGVAGATRVLRGDGRWVTIESIFAEYEKPPSGSIYYAGHFGSFNNASNHVRATYSNVREYPVGTVVIFTVRYSASVSRGNGGVTWSENSIRHLVRGSSGWS